MEDFTIRLLKPNEIECRVGTINGKGLSLLLYKDARADQRILDETFGIFGWKRTHQCIDGNLYCTVEILDRQNGIWVAKQDVGTAGKLENETEKSQASDSFKRACFNWGIGRELYTAPFIWISADKVSIEERNKKFCCNDRFSVGNISYTKERTIKSLSIVNSKNKVVYATGACVTETDTSKHSVSSSQMEMLKKELARTGVQADDVRQRYNIDSLENMPDDIYKRVMLALSKTESISVA